MTELVWDKAGDRRFETGLDRGVLFLPEGGAVPWNGLTSVVDNSKPTVKSYFMDGVKYLDKHVPGSFQATLQAFTYPEELDELTGTAEFSPGVYVHDQMARPFGLSYRTLVGDDTHEVGDEYRLHIIYNVLAIPGAATFNTLSNDPNANEFSWDLSGTPASMFGIRPTSHISLYSKRVDPDFLAQVEDTLYGTEGVPPELPDIVDLLNMTPVIIT